MNMPLFLEILGAYQFWFGVAGLMIFCTLFSFSLRMIVSENPADMEFDLHDPAEKILMYVGVVAFAYAMTIM